MTEPFYDPADWEPDELSANLLYAINAVRNSLLQFALLDKPQTISLFRELPRQFRGLEREIMQEVVDGVIAQMKALTQLTQNVAKGYSNIQPMPDEIWPAAEKLNQSPSNTGPQKNPFAKHGRGGRKR